ncbi:MAG: acyl-CoA thioesterase [Rhodocyclaceae bacterium]|nr:acyl-CoA thioesterase [Pseudomonadota bacterium]MDQ7973110.1 acyl-CoA thioesterase [Rhodocyclaceae bacterium]MDQ8000493.1 acyl-CoA thioesterase [Pseudomonadota bacterium]MDQ8016749.1 acyl-CoA thioesterase [Pseudomonadota bacterium]
MSKQIIYTARVEFGDCDPAGIVWYPNFFGWMDAASRHFFAECGVPRWEETTKTLGVIGTPLVDTKSRFVATASYGDTLKIAVTVREWREKSFVQSYRVTRDDPQGETLILEAEDVRIFGGKRPDGRLRALPIPPEIRALCD